METFKFKKAVQALNYFAQKEGGEIKYMKAVKLVWLSDRSHIRTYGRTITNDDYVAMKNGTVPSKTKDIVLKSAFFENEVIEYSNNYLSEPENYGFTSIREPDYTVFSKTDRRVLEDIYNYYGEKDQFQLSDYSHFFPEWQRFEKELKMGVAKVFEVNVDDFFENGLTDKPFSQTPELLSLSKESHHGNC